MSDNNFLNAGHAFIAGALAGTLMEMKKKGLPVVDVKIIHDIDGDYLPEMILTMSSGDFKISIDPI